VARTVGRYELLRIIGRGGMATVYLARQTDLDRDVALKELKVLAESDPRLARRFLHEARLAGSFSHPNIVTVHDYLEYEGTPYIAMEYLPRGSLRAHVGRMSLAQIGGMLLGVLAGLAHAEERGVVHRDLKPENIMVTVQGSVKIADFGIATATSSAQTVANLTTAGTTLGTPRYMAPERAMGQEIGPPSDLYSVGVMTFELLVGRAPFHDTEAPMAVLMRQINEPIPPVGSLRPDVDPALSDWVSRLVVKDPGRRTQTAATARRELEEILVDLLGPRWLREAGLPARAGGPPAALAGTPELAGPEARGAGGHTMPPATARLLGASASPPAVPTAAAEAGAATVAPGTLVAATGPAPRPARPSVRWVRRLQAVARLAFVVAALVAGVVAATSSGGGGSPPVRNVPASASTLAAKQRPAQTLATGYMREARRFDAQTDAAVVAALERTARAYRRAADAAGRGDVAAYMAARADAKNALADARAAGYDGAVHDDSGAGGPGSYERTSPGGAREEGGGGDPDSNEPTSPGAARDQSGVGDSRSDDPSDDEPDENDDDD
jgi:tRNA A-37 threonylcarbamoyl transferase component Bud32